MKQTLCLIQACSTWRSKWFLLILPVFLSVAQSFGQCPLVCNNIQASLNENCEIEINWDMLIEGNLPASCIADLSVEIFTANGSMIPTSPIITGAYVNETLIGRVTYLPTGSYCESSIAVEDKLDPILSCQDTLVSCFHSTDPSTTGYPIAVDNCTDTLQPVFNDIFTAINCFESDTIQIIDRQWTVTDSSGNSSSCLQKILIDKPGLEDITFPSNQDNIESSVQYCPSADTSTASTGVPHFDGIPIHELCGFLAEYQDVTSQICDGSYAVFREWEIYDGCEGETLVHEQIIQVMDTLPPMLVCPENFSISTGNNNCTATVDLPLPATFDSCSTTINVSLEGSFGAVMGTTISNLNQGVYPTTCIATDDCGNTSTCLFEISVMDEAPPVAVGVNSPLISLLPQEPTFLPASTFDGGSWDNCEEISLEVRRMDSPACNGDDSTPFDTLVPFYCCDAGNTVAVQLRVTDEAGNSSMVTSMAYVQDNLEPQINCPANIVLDCEDDYENLSITGEPSIVENCAGYSLSSSDHLNLNNCGYGTVTRTWTVTDLGGHTSSCDQTITIENLTPFFINPVNSNDPNDDVEWPGNYISNTCGAGLQPGELPAGFNYPIVFTDSICQTVGVSFSDTYLSQPTNACIEILRTWTIIDWCQFNQTTFEGSWSYGQIIRIQNSDAPVILSTCEFEEFCSYDINCEVGTASIEIEVEDDCTPYNQLDIQFEIDHFDNGSIDETGTGNSVNSSQPMGTHRISFSIEDGCQNTTTCSFLFSIKDCKKPSPVCEHMIAEISDQLNPEVEISAFQLDDGSYDNCTNSLDLAFSFSSNLSDTVRQFGCGEMGLNSVEMWVTDSNGNQDFCEVTLEIQANTGACVSNALIAGTTDMENGTPVSLVDVMVNSSTMEDSTLTDAEGLYEFPDLAIGGDYTITPNKVINPLNGVTTFDMLLISKHILGTQPLDAPYKIIAADANQSGTVTTADLLLLLKLILQILVELPNGKSWRFVDSTFEFTEPNDPFQDEFPETISFNNLTEDEMADFIAIKIGDVNGSANGQE